MFMVLRLISLYFALFLRCIVSNKRFLSSFRVEGPNIENDGGNDNREVKTDDRYLDLKAVFSE